MYKRTKIMFGLAVLISTVIDLMIVYTPKIDELTIIYAYTVTLVLYAVFFIFYYLDYKKYGDTVKKLDSSDWLSFLGFVAWLLGSKVLVNQPAQPYVLLLALPLMILYLVVQIKKNPHNIGLNQ